MPDKYGFRFLKPSIEAIDWLGKQMMQDIITETELMLGVLKPYFSKDTKTSK